MLSLGVEKGDRMIIYLPMIPEAFYAMQACARIGVIHCVIFGGFAAAEIPDRLKNSNAKLIITSNKGLEPKKKIRYYPIISEALDLSKMNKLPLLYIKREEFDSDLYSKDFTTVCYHDKMKKAKNADYIKVDSNHPL